MHETLDHAPWREPPMTTIDREPRRDIVPNGEVRAAITSEFASPAEPQTRLFWG